MRHKCLMLDINVRPHYLCKSKMIGNSASEVVMHCSVGHNSTRGIRGFHSTMLCRTPVVGQRSLCYILQNSVIPPEVFVCSVILCSVEPYGSSRSLRGFYSPVICKTSQFRWGVFMVSIILCAVEPHGPTRGLSQVSQISVIARFIMLPRLNSNFL